MKKYKIDTVSKYLKILERNGYDEYIYRGQNEPYSGIDAKVFRPYRGSFKGDKFYDMRRMSKEFYNEVINRISSDEKEHFIAYCQHHGIPTNLLDFSYSPLVALFFACHGKNIRSFKVLDLIDIDAAGNRTINGNIDSLIEDKSYSDFAEVYLISKYRLINITELIVGNDYNGFWTELTSSDALRLKLFEILYSHFKKNTEYIDEWILNIINCTIKNHKDVSIYQYEGYSLKSIKKLIPNPNEDSIRIYRILYNILFEFIMDDNITYGSMYHLEDTQWMAHDKPSLGARIYIAMMLNLVDTASYNGDFLNFDLGLYFTYTPPNLFERIFSQKGLFIYQPYSYELKSVHSFWVLNKQKIVPDVVIEIDKYTHILGQLDVLGYNIGTIYGDIDNVAQSVVERYNKKF